MPASYLLGVLWAGAAAVSALPAITDGGAACLQLIQALTCLLLEETEAPSGAWHYWLIAGGHAQFLVPMCIGETWTICLWTLPPELSV